MDNARKPITGIAYLLSFSAFLGPFSQTIYTPVLPEVADVLHTTGFWVSMTVSFYTLCLAVMQMVYGPLTDTIGRRKVLLAGNVIYLAATLGCYFTHTIGALLALRGLQAIGIAAGSVVAVTVIGDLFEGSKRGKAMGTFQMMVALGPVLGPVAGGWISQWFDFHAVFLVLFAVGCAVLALNIKYVPETKSANRAPESFSWRDYADVLRNRIGFFVAALGFVQYYALYHYLVFLPDLLNERYALSSSQKGMAFISISLFLVIGSYAGGKLAGRMRPARLLSATSLLIAVSIVLFMATKSHSLGLLLFSNMLFGLFVGLSLPVQTVLLTATFLNKRATSVGVYNFLRYMGMTLGPVGGAVLLHAGGLDAAFGFAALLSVGCCWLGWRLDRSGETLRKAGRGAGE
ncbi:MFS transporter [Paenibacillus hodogayensis]|uniref:MFS transporter n=1 Tax=Paenibacillus hodogayensis TaxID=279208 RepID=A0ABV5VZC4_9BACL